MFTKVLPGLETIGKVKYKGSEYRTNLCPVFRWLEHTNTESLDILDWYSNGIQKMAILDANHLNTGPEFEHFWSAPKSWSHYFFPIFFCSFSDVFVDFSCEITEKGFK